MASTPLFWMPPTKLFHVAVLWDQGTIIRYMFTRLPLALAAVCCKVRVALTIVAPGGTWPGSLPKMLLNLRSPWDSPPALA